MPPRPTIGAPVQNFHVFVLDERGMTQPIGAPGEIYHAGRSVGRGYYGRNRY